MATLVLSTVGTALGGPIGGAVGALIGQSFDRQLLAPASRGPKLGDLNVQSSSYGTQIPRIYGSMRVAGSVVWATDLIESEQTTGVKGQPDVVYGYSVSLAVALSSRPVGAIGRIWADGKLLRGAEGDFKVPTSFRFHDGSEAQDVDPLIASAEGIANAPAYRGIALAVFENLELAAFGNRIPFMTFEVLAEPDPPTISTILADASAGAMESDVDRTIIGYAAYGRSIAESVQTLVDCFDVPLFDDGSIVRTPFDPLPVALDADELGNSADGQKTPVLQREQLPARAAPSALRMTYYDPARDYQTGEVRAIAGASDGNEIHQELPAVLTADDAKTLVQQVLARQWAARDRLTLRLPPARISLEPGAIVEPGLTPSAWVADKCTVDGFVTIVELRPAWQPSATLLGDPGRIVPNHDIVEQPNILALIDVADVASAPGNGPTVLIAASSPNEGWDMKPVTVSSSGQSFATQTSVRKSVLGTALTALRDAEPFLIDAAGSVDIELVDQQQWLTSCDDDALANGANLAVIGSELVQFGEVTPLGEGRFRLGHLLRGRGGTEWATATHLDGEVFCLMDASSLRSLSLPIWMRGSPLTINDRDGATASLTFSAEAVRPLSPINLTAAFEPFGDLRLSWTRRSRTGFAWIDEVDAPLGESRELYQLALTGAEASLELTAEQPTVVVAASDLATFGAGPATVEVRQVGDWAASRPAQITIDLP